MKRLITLALLSVSATAFAHDVDPFGFETQATTGTLSRAEVVENMNRPGTVSMKIDDQGRLITAPSTKRRAQVVAETEAAARLGLIRHGELGPIPANEAQERVINLAGLRALEQSGSIE